MLIGVAWSQSLVLVPAVLLSVGLFGAAAFALMPKFLGWVAVVCLLFFVIGTWRMATVFHFAWRFGYLLRLGPDGIDGQGLVHLPWDAVLGLDVLERNHGGRSRPELRLLMRDAESPSPSWAFAKLGRVLRHGDELVITGALWNVDAAGLREAVPGLLRRFAPHVDMDWCSGMSRDSTLERLRLRELERVAEQQKAAAMERMRLAPPSEAAEALSAWTDASNRQLDLMQRQVGTFTLQRERRVGTRKRTQVLWLVALLVLLPGLSWLLRQV